MGLLEEHNNIGGFLEEEEFVKEGEEELRS